MMANVHYKDDMIYITHLTRNILKLHGIWPSYNRRSIGESILKYFLISISCILLYGVSIPIMLFYLFEKRTQVKMRIIPSIVFAIMSIGKYSDLIFREKNLRLCLKHIEEDWRTVNNAEARDTMIESAKIGRQLVIICAVFMYGSGISFRTFLPFARGKIVTAQNVTIRPLPFPGYYYFDTQVSPTYEIIFTTQCLGGFVANSITIGLCGLAAVFILHACGQLKILVDLMKNLGEEQWQEKQEVNRKLAKIVEHQIRIRGFLQLVENILQQSSLIELMGCTIMACLIGYIIIMEWENSNSSAICFYFALLVSALINVFMFCYTGEQLLVQAEEVTRTSCTLDWYRLPNKEARAIVLVIIISNMPIKITAGRIIDLSFRTYGNVIKTAVTYFNMLLKMID